MSAVRSLYTTLIAATLFWASVAGALPQPTVVYLTDTEGAWSRVEDFLQNNPAFVADSRGGWKVREGFVFVFGGDATDKGPDSRRILQFLRNLRESSRAGSVVELPGNRDAVKVRIRQELSSWGMAHPPEAYVTWLADNHLSESVANRLKWTLATTMGAPGLFESWRGELARAQGVSMTSVSDAQVAADLIAEMNPDGSMGQYLQSARLIHREGDTLFVHGAITDENLFQIPGDPPRLANTLDEWITESNQWYRDQISQWRSWTPENPARPAEGLIRYIAQLPGTVANAQSVIYGRFAGGDGVSTLSSEVERRLHAAGIRRIVVGHTPAGHSPLILRGQQVEVINADNSTEPHGTRVTLTPDRTRIESQIRMGPPGNEVAVPVDFSWQVGDPHDPIGKRPAGSPEVVTARLADGELIAYENQRQPGAYAFRAVYRRTPQTELHTQGLHSPYPAVATPHSYFDWDENVVLAVRGVPPSIYLYDRETGAQRVLTPAEFSLVEQQLGKPGPWEKFEMRRASAPDGGSFREFRDTPGLPTFRNQVDGLLSQPDEIWQGPNFQAFQRAMSDPRSAERAGIITAREHAPESIYEGLKRLQERGYIRYLPRLENIYPIGNPRYASLGPNAAARKVAVMTEILDRLQGEANRARSDGRPSAQRWSFSDDDWKNIEKASTTLGEGVRAGRWPDVALELEFTGHHDPAHAPALFSLGRDGLHKRSGTSFGACFESNFTHILLQP